MVNATSSPWSIKIADTLLSEFKNDYHPKISNKWGYVSGMTLMALHRLGEWSGNEKYTNVMKQQVDLFIQEDGTIRTYTLEDYNLDQINEGKNLFYLWQLTGEQKYEKAIRLLVTQLAGQPRTSEGGFWHKKIY